MIDIHAHVLPGLDDGPKELELSIAMAKAATEDGTTHLTATPHTLNGLYRNTRQSIIEKVKEFQEVLDKHDIQLKVLPGSDVALIPGLVHAIEDGEVMTVNDGNKYILVELQPYFFPEKIKKIIFDLQMIGLTPVLTHPERDPKILENPELLVDFVEMGVISQITAMSITGGFGSRIKEFSNLLLRHGLVHIISSDCHSMKRRTPKLSHSVKEAALIVGDKLASQMVNDFPLAIIEGRDFKVPPHLPLKKKRRFMFWKKQNS